MTPARRLRAPSRDQLTSELTAPAPRAEPLAPRLRDALVERLDPRSPSTRVAGARRARLDAYTVERGATVFATPFRWSARAARRVLGTATARRVVDGSAPDALRAACDEVDRLCDRAARGLVRPGSLAAWLASEPSAVRRLCGLEGATWAAGLLGLVDASRGVSVGIADAWFELPGGALTLHGRRDAIATAAGSPRRSLLRLRDGLPGPRSVEGLLVDGLLEALAAPELPLPARVVGAWPDTGICLAVDFDDEAARVAARELVSAASSLEVLESTRTAPIVEAAAA